MENAVSESDRLSGIDENVCNLHANIWNMVLGIDKNTRLCLYMGVEMALLKFNFLVFLNLHLRS